MLLNLFASLQLGMNSFGSDVASLCFEFIQVRSLFSPFWMQSEFDVFYIDFCTRPGFIVTHGQNGYVYSSLRSYETIP